MPIVFPTQTPRRGRRRYLWRCKTRTSPYAKRNHERRLSLPLIVARWPWSPVGKRRWPSRDWLKTEATWSSQGKALQLRAYQESHHESMRRASTKEATQITNCGWKTLQITSIYSQVRLMAPSSMSRIPRTMSTNWKRTITSLWSQMLEATPATRTLSKNLKRLISQDQLQDKRTPSYQMQFHTLLVSKATKQVIIGAWGSWVALLWLRCSKPCHPLTPQVEMELLRSLVKAPNTFLMGKTPHQKTII